jgi:hypothetical protein
MKKYAHPLKVASMVIALAGYFVANELQKRETEEYIDKALAKRDEVPTPETISSVV